MSDTYTKLFSSITASTIWGEPHATRIVWVTMLAMADARGNVYASVPGLARIANATRAETEAALASFLAPDPDSRTSDHEGRRIEAIDGGWRLLNHGKFAAVRNAEERREYKAEWARKSRAESKDIPPIPVDTCGQSGTKSTVSAPLTPALTPEKQEQEGIASQSKGAPIGLPDWLDASAWRDWHLFRNSRKGWTPKARSLSLGTLTKLHADGQDQRAVIEQSIERGWTGLFPVKPNNHGAPHATHRPSPFERVAIANRAAEQRAAIEDGLAMP